MCIPHNLRTIVCICEATRGASLGMFVIIESVLTDAKIWAVGMTPPSRTGADNAVVRGCAAWEIQCPPAHASSWCEAESLSSQSGQWGGKSE